MCTSMAAWAGGRWMRRVCVQRGSRWVSLKVWATLPIRHFSGGKGPFPGWFGLGALMVVRKRPLDPLWS